MIHLKNTISKTEMDIVLEKTKKVHKEYNINKSKKDTLSLEECLVLVILVYYPLLAAEIDSYENEKEIKLTVPNIVMLMTKK